MNFIRRVWHLLNRRRFERELTREMRDHRDQMRDPSSFGQDTHRFIEQSRDAWGWNWLDDAMQDLSVGVRALLKSPSFAITATLILSFGIGLNLTLYQTMNGALLRPPAIKGSESVARFQRSGPHWTSTSVAYPVAEFVKANNAVLSAVMVETGSNLAWGPDAAEQIESSFVSTNWFDELGYGPLHGRLFSEALDANADVPPAVLGFTFWRSHLGGDPGVVGKTVFLDRKPVIVVGIAPQNLPAFDFEVPDIYLPVTLREYFYPQSPFRTAWNSDNVAMYARFKPGVSRSDVRESMRATMQTIATEHSNVEKGQWLEPLMAADNFMRPKERRDTLAIVSLIAMLTSLVLIVAAANLGNLVMSRATGRVRELGVRMALGARRGRIIRQLVVESIPMVALGTVGSLAFAAAASGLIASLAEFPPYIDLRIDWHTMAVAMAMASLALIVVGLLPAWKVAQQHLIDGLKDGGQHVSRTLDRALVRRVMMTAQVAGSCLLLIVAGMMARSLQRVLLSDLGFDYQKAAVLEMPLGRYGFNAEQARTQWDTVKERVVANPEVEAAAIVTAPPLGGRENETAYDSLHGLIAMPQSVDPEYFAVMRIPLLSGRLFAPREEHVVVISRRLALEMYGSLDVLGQDFPRTADKGRSRAQDVARLAPPEGTIVGIVGDAHSIKISATDVTELYKPLATSDFSLVWLVARARTNADRLPPVLREAASIVPRVTPTAHAMHEDFDRRTRGPRIASAISAGIGALTLALACLGIFGVVSYGVALRTKELGIRMALGANRGALLRVVLWQVAIPIAIGLVVGLTASVPAGRALAGEPFYLESLDPAVLVTALVMFLAAALSAAAVPALNVLRSNPLESLRHS